MPLSFIKQLTLKISMELPEKLTPPQQGLGTAVWSEGSIPHTVNQIIDYLAEREEVEHEPIMSPSQIDEALFNNYRGPTPLFRADEICSNYNYPNEGDFSLEFESREKLEQAREALLKLTE